MFDKLPDTAVDFRDWPWKKIKPYYDDLLARDLTQESLHQWMLDWSKLTALVQDARWGSYVDTTRDTTDEAATRRYERVLEEIYPPAQVAEAALKQKLLDSGLEPEDFAIQLRNMQSDNDLFREENLPLQAETLKLSTKYEALRGAQTVEWEGEEVTIYQLGPAFQDVDRERRERAWRLMAERRLVDREAVNDLWRELYKRRVQIAKNAGFDNYRSYMWRKLKRFDYTPEDARTFHAAIAETFVPAVKRQYEKRRQQMGLDTLRPWDAEWFTAVDPLGRPSLKPYQTDEEFQDISTAIFEKVDPYFGETYRIMRERGNLDLENRKGKGPGGYNQPFLAEGLSFIFQNNVGLPDDVMTMLHEGGHAFHFREVAERLPYVMQYDDDSLTMEVAEVASMAMELLAAPYLLKREGGFYDEADYARARIEHLEGIIRFLPYMAVIDSIQHWAYTNPDQGGDPDRVDEKFAELWDTYMLGVDYSGLEDVKRSRWQWQLHIFSDPFYYIEYGLAQMGALQVWRNALDDQPKAVRQYRDALALGATRTIPEFFATAGAKFVFDADALGELVDLIETEMAKLEAMA